MAVTASAMRFVLRQVQDLMNSPIEGIRLLETDDLSVIAADINGPEDTPYFGGVFRVELVLGENFPEQPPLGFFRTRIFHPNVSEKGEICVNTLKKDWDAALGLRHVFTVIRCLLIEPNPESALNEEAGRLLLEEYSEYVRLAKMMTSIHAPKNTSAAAATATGTTTTSGPSGLSVRTATHSNSNSSTNCVGGGVVKDTGSSVPSKSTTSMSAMDKRKAALKRL
mmetsp:Transcript_37269/g.43504  ORF Transcript_37269/g.43504 Transcript_37269/m.43504 type:complete len:224 (+) Transcript_37269:51-722(+)